MNEEAQRRAAERSIGADFLLDAIGEAEGMSVNRGELDAEIERLATRAGRTPTNCAGRLSSKAGLRPWPVISFEERPSTTWWIKPKSRTKPADRPSTIPEQGALHG